MPGQCLPIGPPFGGVPVFDPGAGALGFGVAGAGVVVDGVLDCVVEAPVLVEPDDAAPALEMPANAPPVASAPATIVAPSSFDVFMRSNLLLVGLGWLCRSMVRHVPKSSHRSV
jgi:hypothetical protein